MRGSSVAQHRIPRVYACYLLRSLSKPNQTYVGSTPDPVRRLRQHNGLVKNGAFYTRMARPWTMDVVVYGFPSKLAALQFEWSWQSPHLSRHLRVCDRPGGSIATYAGRSAEPLFPATRRTSKSRSGHTRVRQRSTSEPEHKFVVLRALLASEPFCCWDLHVALHSEYAFGLWRYMERAHPDRYRWSRITRRPLPAAYPSLSCDFRGVLGDREPLAYDEHAAWPPLPEAGARSVTQKRAGAKGAVKEYLWDELTPPARDAETMGLSWDEWRAAPTGSASPVQLDDAARTIEAQAQQACTITSCGVCHESTENQTYAYCPHACGAVFHLSCLARHSLEREAAARSVRGRIYCLPMTATCPVCHRPPVPWAQVVRRLFSR